MDKDAVFCYACRKFTSASSDASFSIKGLNGRKHAIDTGKGFNKHAVSKERLTCEAMWRESEKRRGTGKEISTLLIVKINLREDIAGFASVLDDNSSMGLFLSLFENIMCKDPELTRLTNSQKSAVT